MSARAKAAADGAKPGEGGAAAACRGGRSFPCARSDTALVLIDMQTDFLEPTGRIGQHYANTDSPIRSGMEGCRRLLAAARAAGLTIAHSRSHRYGSTVRDELVGTSDEGYELHPTLRALPGEIVVDKWTYGAFASTPLEDELRARGVERIFLCGVLTNVCVLSTASQAVDRFFRVCLVEDACAAFNQEWHDAAIKLISEPQIGKGHNAQVGLYFGEVAKVADVEAALAPLAKLPKLAIQSTPVVKVVHDLEKRAAMSARAKAAADGAKPGEGGAAAACRGGRSFPCARSDTALVLIDMQTDFLEPTGRIGQHYANTDSPIRSGMEGCRRLLAAARAAGLTIAHSRSHRYGSTVRDELVGTSDEGYELHPTLRALPGEIVVDKWTYGAFASTPLEDELRARGVERIFLCGVLTNVCVLSTASQAVDRFFRVCLVEDACAAFNQEWHDAAIKLISEPQIGKGHNAQVGLYFGEVAKVADVEAALAPLAKLPKQISTRPQGTITLKGAKPKPCELPLATTAVLMIDMQKDFLDPAGFGGALGNDVTPCTTIVPACEELFAAWRKVGGPMVHTLEAHAPDLSDCPESKRCGPRAPPDGKRIGQVLSKEMGRILVRGEPGNGLIPQLDARAGEKVVHKPGKGAFYKTDLEEHLRAMGITHLIMGGVTTEVCVQTTMREANDRGFDCLLLEDCTASYFPEFKAHTLQQVAAQGGIVGWTATSEELLAALSAL